MKPVPEKKDRKVFSIDLSMFDLDSFKKNPIVLLDGNISRPPVGIAQYVTKKIVASCMRIGFIGNFQVPFTTENDRVWSFEKLGHEVIKFQENKTTVTELLLAHQQVDVLFYSHTHGWQIPALREVFLKYKEWSIPTVSVHLDRWAGLARESDVGKEATWFTEYIFMADGSPEAVELYKKHNLNWFWLKPGVVERDCYIASADPMRFPHDIIFVGSKNYHKEYPFRPKLINWLQQQYGKRFAHYGNDGLATMRGHDLNTLYASAKVVVGDSCFGGQPYYWSDRVPETIGRGGVLVHPYCEGMGDLPLATYERGDFSSLKTIIEYYLNNPEFREGYRIHAHEHVKAHETYTARASEMLEIIFKKG